MERNSSFMLVLEDSQVLSTLLLSWMEERFPNKHVANVSTIADARDFIESVVVDFYMVDLNLPDGNGMDFIREVRAKTPGARFVVMTNSTTANRVRAEVDTLGPVCFFEKPLDLAVVEKVLRPILDPTAPAPVGFSAAIQNTDPISILQLKCLAQATGIIEFLSAQGSIGRVFLLNGDIVNAEAVGLTGIPALAKMVAWTDGAARELPLKDQSPVMEIDMNWEMALMEATRLSDEENSEAGEKEADINQVETAIRAGKKPTPPPKSKK